MIDAASHPNRRTQRRIGKRAHSGRLARELEQRHDGEGQLQAQYDLTGDQQIGHLTGTEKTGLLPGRERSRPGASLGVVSTDAFGTSRSLP